MNVDTDLPARRRRAAKLLTQAVNSYDVPDFITNALVVAINYACEDNGLPRPDWLTKPEGDGDGHTLAEMWERAHAAKDDPEPIHNSGGFNLMLSAGTITLGTALANVAGVNVRFLLDIQQTDTFKFFTNVEALP